MSLRVKKTLTHLGIGVAVVVVFTLIGISHKPAHFGFTLPFGIFAAFWLALTGYTWWVWGNSEKAVALRAKAEQRKAAKLTR